MKNCGQNTVQTVPVGPLHQAQHPSINRSPMGYRGSSSKRAGWQSSSMACPLTSSSMSLQKLNPTSVLHHTGSWTSHFRWGVQHHNLNSSQDLVWLGHSKLQPKKPHLLLFAHACLVDQSCLFETLWTVAHQAPLSMRFSRQEYWSGLPFHPPGDLPHPGIEPKSPVLEADSLPLHHLGSPYFCLKPHKPSICRRFFFSILPSASWTSFIYLQPLILFTGR